MVERLIIRQSKSRLIILSSLCLIVIALPFLKMSEVNALPILDRSITLSDSVGNASGVTYTMSFSALSTVTPVKSVEVKFYNSPSDLTTPSGFSSSSSTLSSQPTGLGATSGWSVDSTSLGALRISNSLNSTNSSGPVSIVWGGVHNPSANNSSFFAVISTYSNDDYTGLIDSGSVALATSAQIQVALTVGETLTFCTGTSILGQDCASIAGNVVNLGTGSTTVTAKGTSVFAASTNGASGYTISVNGSTLTSGVNTITPLSSGSTSATNTKQFGLNLASANTTPTVGAAKTGLGTATVATNYGINDTFRFVDGDSIASVSGPTNANTFTVSYIANIDGVTPAGVYKTNLTYLATANF